MDAEKELPKRKQKCLGSYDYSSCGAYAKIRTVGAVTNYILKRNKMNIEIPEKM